MYPFGYGCIVGKVALASLMCLFVGGKDRLERKALRGLGGIKPGALYRFPDHPFGFPFQRIRHRQGGQGTLPFFDSLDGALDQVGIHERPSRVMDEDLARRIFAERLKAEPHRLLPAPATRYGSNPVHIRPGRLMK